MFLILAGGRKRGVGEGSQLLILAGGRWSALARDLARSGSKIRHLGRV
jgi:hypothetical protein